jgi:hypothetical protein
MIKFLKPKTKKLSSVTNQLVMKMPYEKRRQETPTKCNSQLKNRYGLRTVAGTEDLKHISLIPYLYQSQYHVYI